MTANQSKVNEAAVKAEPWGEWPSGLRHCNQNQKVTVYFYLKTCSLLHRKVGNFFNYFLYFKTVQLDANSAW